MFACRPTRFSLLSACIAGAVAPASLAQGGQQGPPPVTPNILVVLLDDVGLDPLRLYNALLDGTWTGMCSFESPTPRPCLDSLEEIAGHGIAFTEAWANPTCSATRSALLTGRYGFRTGIGKPVNVGSGFNLCDAELLIPKSSGAGIHAEGLANGTCLPRSTPSKPKGRRTPGGTVLTTSKGSSTL